MLTRDRARQLALLGFAALALAASGCGGGEKAESPLDEALGYLSADAAFVAVIDTNIEGSQYQAAGKILDKFPFGDQILESLKSEIRSGSDVDFDRDLKPLLGNDFVVGADDPQAIIDDANQDFVAAIQVKDGDKLRKLLKESDDTEARGESNGADLFEDTKDGEFAAVKDDTFVLAPSKKLVEEALEQRQADDRLREEDLDGILKGLPADAAIRTYFDVQELLANDPDTKEALKVDWVRSLRTFGAAARIAEDEISIDFNLTTAGDLDPKDLPLASGGEAPQVLSRPKGSPALSLGVRDLAQIVEFALATGKKVDPAQFGQLDAAKVQIKARTGVDFDSDLLEQLKGNAQALIDPSGSFAAREKLDDPEAFRRTLRRLAPVVGDFAEGGGLAGAKVSRSGGLYVLRSSGGTEIAYGVVGDHLVVADSAVRARRVASQDAEELSGAQGSVVATADAEALIKQAFAQIVRSSGGLGQLGGLGAIGIAGFDIPLGDVTAWVRIEKDGLRGELTLAID